MRLTRVKALLDAGRHGGITATTAIFNKLAGTVAAARRLRANHVAASSPVVSGNGATAGEHATIRAELEAGLAKAQAAWQKASDELDKAQIVRAAAKANWEKVVACQTKSEANRRKSDADRRKSDEVLDRLMPDQRSSDADRRRANAVLAAFVRTVAERHEAFVERNNAETSWANAAADLIAAIAKRKKAVAALEEINRAEGKP